MKNKRPSVPVLDRNSFGTELTPQALARWQEDIHAADESNAENVISILGVIGEDIFGEGITARRISAQLRSMGDKEVQVHINSPGGNLFEGIAIYNVLREHKQIVNVKILGLAASVASIIAMAGDNVQIGKAGFIIIHNAWTVAVGDQHDFRELADTLEPLDAAMAEVYSAKSGEKVEAIRAMMSKETYFNGTEAVERGFADALLPADQVKKKAKAESEFTPNAAVHRLDVILAKAGMPRSERRQLIGDLKTGTPRAADDPKPSAGREMDEAMATLRGIKFG